VKVVIVFGFLYCKYKSFYALSKILYAVPLIRTDQVASEVTASVVTAPALVPDEPNTAWLFPVASASRPKSNEPSKLPELQPSPIAVLELPVVCEIKQLAPMAVLALPDVLAANALKPTAVLFTPVLNFNAW
jgi:hypothetical protein